MRNLLDLRENNTTSLIETRRDLVLIIGLILEIVDNFITNLEETEFKSSFKKSNQLRITHIILVSLEVQQLATSF